MLVEVQQLNEQNMDVYLACGCHPQDGRIGDEQRQRMESKRLWAESMIPKGLGARVAFCEDYPAGFAEFMPIEIAPAPVQGKKLLFITDIHVNSDDKGGEINLEHVGIGRLLVRSVEQFAREKGYAGLATLALMGDRLPEGFYETVGFDLIEQKDNVCLLWYPFIDDCPQPVIWEGNFTPKVRTDGVQVEVIRTTQCPAVNAQELWGQVVSEYDHRVSFNEYSGDDRTLMNLQCVTGCAGVFVNGEPAPGRSITAAEIRIIIDQALAEIPAVNRS